MAYGDDTVTLATFDTKVPENVFLEVTSITMEEFRQLRDGGIFYDPAIGERKEYKTDRHAEKRIKLSLGGMSPIQYRQSLGLLAA